MATAKIIFLFLGVVALAIWCFMLIKNKKKVEPYVTLRTEKEQREFDPLSATYNAKEFRRKR
jgi:hypothetical protein